MSDQNTIDDFLSQRILAVVGVSRERSKYGNLVYRRLKAHGYEVLAINPGIETVEGDPCFPDLAALPESVGGIIVVVPPEKTELIVREAAMAGINRIWMQPGSESEAAVRFCQENGIHVIYGLCVMTLSGA